MPGSKRARRAQPPARCRVAGAASCCWIEPEIEQLGGETACAALEVDRHQLSRCLVCCYEEHIEDAQRAAALQPLEGADQLALERGARVESECQELPGGQGYLICHPPSLTGERWLCITRIGGCRGSF